MARLAFLYRANNLWSAATAVLSASASASSLPAANAADADRSKVWRSTTTTGDQWLKADFGSALPVAAVAVANLKIHTGGGSCKLQSSDNDAAWSDAVTLGTPDQDSRVVFALGTYGTHRYWRFLFTNTGAVNEYVELGFAFLGVTVVPAINMNAPIDAQRIDPSVAGVSLDGQKTFAIRSTFFSTSLVFQDVSAADLATHLALFRSVGVHTPLFLLLDQTTTWQAWLGRIVSKISHQIQWNNRFTVSFDFEEAL